MSEFTRQEAADIALAAAKEAVRQQEERMFGLLGFNIANLDDMKQMRQDLEFAHSLRIKTSQAGAKVLLTIVGALTTAAVIGAWEGIKTMLHLAP